MTQKTVNPASLATGRAGNSITGFEALDITSNTALASYPQAYIAQRFHVQPVIARLVCDLAGFGGRAR
jgi:hypothetical protein